MARKKHNGVYYDDQANYQQMINDTTDNQKKAVYERKRNAKIGGEGLGYGTTDLYSQYLPTDTTPYDIDADYTTQINRALGNLDYTSAYNLNAARNSKIDNEALPYAKNTMLDVFNPNFQSSVPNYQFTPYDLNQNADFQTWDPIRQQQWDAVTGLQTYNSEGDEELQALYGAANKLLEGYRNSVFDYDLQSDPLYDQYKDQYTTLGKEAMADTMAQNAALTGGYGSSYSQGTGQQAYEHYLGRLNDVIPELYAQAYSQWADQRQRELNAIMQMYNYGGTMYNQHRTDVNDANDQQWRLYDVADQNRQNALDTGYGIWRDNQQMAMDANQQAWEREYAANDLAYNRAAQSYQNAYQTRQDAMGNVFSWIQQTGQLPPESFLQAAGISTDEAQSYLDGILMQAELAAASSGGGGGSGRSGGSGRRSSGGSSGYSYTPDSASGSSEEYVTGGFDSNGYKSVSGSGGKNVTSGFEQSLANREKLWWNELASASGTKSKTQMRNMVMNWVNNGLSQATAAQMILRYGLDQEDDQKLTYNKNANNRTVKKYAK